MITRHGIKIKSHKALFLFFSIRDIMKMHFNMINKHSPQLNTPSAFLLRRNLTGQENMQRIKILALVFGSIFLAGCSLSGSGSGIISSNSGSLWKSIDGGKTWEVKNKVDEKATIPQVDVLNIAFNLQDGKNIFSGTKDAILLKTNDGGETWTKANFSSIKIYGLDVDPNDGKIIYASGILDKRGKIFKSLDGGENWKEIFTMPADGPLVVYLIIDKKSSNNIYVATSDNQILKSQDSGNSWQNVLNAENPIIKIYLDQKNDNLLYAIDQNGTIFRSEDAGKTFENMMEKISASLENVSTLSTIETDPNNENWIYAGGETGLIISKDKGEKWSQITSTINNSKDYPIKTIAINPYNSNEIVYGASLAVYKSIDGGNNWTTSQFESDKTIRIIKYNPQNGSEIWVGFSK